MRRTLLLGYTLILSFLVSISVYADARLQLVHNCSDPSASVVDIYVNGTKYDDVRYRTATAFVSVPSAVDVRLVVAKNTSTNVNDGAVFTAVTQFEDGKEYIAIAGGNVGSAFSNPYNRDLGFTIFQNPARSQSSPQTVSVALFHGITDAPKIDVYVNGGEAPFVRNLDYGVMTPYAPLPISTFEFGISPAFTNSIIARYRFNTQPYGGLAGIIVASGYYNSLLNSNGAPLALFWVGPQGGAFVPLELIGINTTSVVDLELQSSMSLLPNPANSDVQVRFSTEQSSTAMNIQIVSLLGEVVYSSVKEYPSGNHTLPLNTDSFSNGMYMVHLSSGNRIATQRLIIAR
jgi:hypothetical protein